MQEADWIRRCIYFNKIKVWKHNKQLEVRPGVKSPGVKMRPWRPHWSSTGINMTAPGAGTWARTVGFTRGSWRTSTGM